MPRVSREQSEKHHEEIMQASSRLFRERGLNGVSVAQLMAAVGLTHGSFYCHFASKEALAAAACTHAFDQSAARWSNVIAANDDSHAAISSIIKRYLAEANRTGAGPECAATGFAGDVAREPADSPIHASFAAGLEKLISTLAGQFAAENGSPRREAITLFSTLVGALTLARATNGDPLSEEIFQSLKETFALQFDAKSKAPSRRP